MPRFMPFPDRPDAVLGYHQVPADVIEEAETLVEWARRSVAVALAARTAKSKPKRTAKRPAKAKAKAKPGGKLKAKPARKTPRKTKGRRR
jgi:hypothetical protein